MSDSESVDSFEEFSGDGVDYNALFITDIRFVDRDNAFKWAQKIALNNGFALVKATNGAKNRSQPELLASYFRCSRHGRTKAIYDPECSKKKQRSQKCDCKFRIRAVQNYHFEGNERVILWNIVTAKGFGYHNHHLTKYKDGDRHHAGLNEEEKAYIEQQYRANVLPRDIKSGLHLKTPDKPQPSSTQIYSETRKIRREMRGERNPAQQMLSLAVEACYVHWHEVNDETGELTHIFKSHPEAVKLFRAYPHVVLIDSTYKTNMYKMTLVEVVGVTPTGSSFLIACVMIPAESEEGYTWMLQKLVTLLECTGASPKAFVTDRELGLIAALQTLFPDTPHLLCRWHVNRAIENRATLIYKKDFLKYLALKNPESGWINVIDATTEEAFKYAWAAFSSKWTPIADYAARTWGEHAKKFVLCYTNEYFHLGNTATSRVESVHSLLKAWLKSAHLTLDTMWSRMHSMLEAQHSKIRKELEDSRTRPRITDRIFSLLHGKVSIKAIELMEEEMSRGVKLGIGLKERCGCALKTTHGLPCACQLVRLRDKGKRVHLSDVHNFWRTLEYDNVPMEMPKNDNDMLEELLEKARKSDPVYEKIFIEKLRDVLHPEDEDIHEPSVRQNPKGRPRSSNTRSKSSFEHSQRRYGTPSTDASANVGHRLMDFPHGPPGSPLECNYTVGLFSTWSKRYGVPEAVWSHFDGWVDVGSDGHCGFRVISHASRGREDDYVQMREWCLREIRSHECYKGLYEDFRVTPSGMTRYDLTLRRIGFLLQSSCGVDHWMYSDDLFAFASIFNWTICVIAKVCYATQPNQWQCSTILPLRSGHQTVAPYGVLWIVKHNSHWMWLHSRGPPEEVPMTPIDPSWTVFKDESVAHYGALYKSNIKNWHTSMGTTPRVPRRRTSSPVAARTLNFDDLVHVDD